MTCAGRDPARWRSSLIDGALVALFFSVVLLIGGAGASYPLLEAAVEALSLPLLCHTLIRRDFRVPVSRVEWLLIGLIVAIPLLQLVPIGIGLWAGLPGRAAGGRVLAEAGLRPASMPLSLAAEQTRRAGFALLPGLAAFVAGRNLSPEGRLLAGRTLLAMAALSACLGALQLAMGATSRGPAYESSQLGQAIGLFVNRNHQAAMLLIAICLAPSLLARADRRGVTPASLGLILLFAAGALATTSRTALMLLPFCLAPLLVPALRRSRKEVAAAAGLLVLLLLAGWCEGALPNLLARFGGEPEPRLVFWRTSWAAARAYWPTGAGVGAFKLVYPMFERRADLTPFVVNHAHDDYIELLLEAGAAAGAAMLLFLFWYGDRIRRALAAPRLGGGMAAGALGGIAVLLAYSAVEYPLRTLSLTAVFGLLCALADPTPLPAAGGPPRSHVGRLRAVAVVIVALALAALVLREGLARRALAQDRPERAVALQPRSSAAWTELAARDLDAGRFAAAAIHARLALGLEPLRQQALTILALAERGRGRPDQADHALRAAAELGWRDPATQLWAMARFADAGRSDAATERADALLRQDRATPALLAAMRAGAADPSFARSLARLLAGDPPWRGRYLTRLTDLDARGAAAHEGLLHAMAAAGAPPTPDEAGALVARAAELGQDDLARRVWMTFGPSSPGNLLPDPRFTRVDDGASARRGVFGWRRTDLPGLETEPSGHRTDLLLDRSAAGMLLHQDLYLGPGAYEFQLDFSASGPIGGGALIWTVTCARGGARIDQGQTWTAMGRARGRAALRFAVSAECPIQRLALNGGGVGLGVARLTPSRAVLTRLAAAPE